MDGAGLPEVPLILQDNLITATASKAMFSCGTQETSELNIHTGDSHVVLLGNLPDDITTTPWHLCL